MGHIPIETPHTSQDHQFPTIMTFRLQEHEDRQSNPEALPNSQDRNHISRKVHNPTRKKWFGWQQQLQMNFVVRISTIPMVNLVLQCTMMLVSEELPVPILQPLRILMRHYLTHNITHNSTQNRLVSIPTGYMEESPIIRRPSSWGLLPANRRPNIR